MKLPGWIGAALFATMLASGVSAETAGPAVAPKVKAIVVENLGVDAAKVRPEASLVKDLGADELDMVELVMALEEAFGIEIGDNDAGKAKTVGDMIALVKRLKSGH